MKKLLFIFCIFLASCKTQRTITYNECIESYATTICVCNDLFGISEPDLICEN